MYLYFSSSIEPKHFWTWELHPGWCYNAGLFPCSLSFHPELALLLVSSLEYRPLFYLFEALYTFLVWHNPLDQAGGQSKREWSCTMKKSMKCLLVPLSPPEEVSSDSQPFWDLAGAQDLAHLQTATTIQDFGRRQDLMQLQKQIFAPRRTNFCSQKQIFAPPFCKLQTQADFL